ncbi:NAPDH-dependent diflavin reductase [Thecaphora frezii]
MASPPPPSGIPDLSQLSLSSPSPSPSPSTSPSPTPTPSRASLLILYATETGTSLSLSETLYLQALRRRFRTVLCSLSDIDPASLVHTDSFVLLLISTTGQGEFPTAARAFWQFWLRSDLPGDLLEGCRFAAFGLGDSSYAKFNWPVRMVARRWSALGAEQIVQHGEGDERHYLGIDGSFQPWLETLWSRLDELVPMPPGVEEVAEEQILPPRFEVRFLDDADEAAAAAVRDATTSSDATISSSASPSTSSSSTTTAAAPAASASSPSGPSSPHASVNGSISPASFPSDLGPPPPGTVWSLVTQNKRITHPSHFQDVRLLTLTSLPSSPPLRYSAGDVLHLLPSNESSDVTRLLSRLGWTSVADKPLILEPSSFHHHPALPPYLPRGRTTLRRLLTQHLDAFSVPRRGFFDFIRRFSPAGSMEREKLDEFCTPGEGADEMYEYAMRVRRTMAEVLYEFGSVKVEPRWVAELFPGLRERAFSIASSPLMDDTSITLATALVTYQTRLSDPRWGICSKYLSTLAISSIVPVRIARGTLHLPASPNVPLILVGPGTGIAPLRSLLHTRLVQNRQTNTKSECWVFAGCRYRKRDWLFAEEWEQFDPASVSSARSEDGTVQHENGSAQPTTAKQGPNPQWAEYSTTTAVQVRLAASRDGPEKVYVQDLIETEGEQVWRLLANGACVYVCGTSGNMPTQVRGAVQKVAVKHGGLDDDQAKRFVDTLHRLQRWNEECWS